jgi:hypothetical protein
LLFQGEILKAISCPQTRNHLQPIEKQSIMQYKFKLRTEKLNNDGKQSNPLYTKKEMTLHLATIFL